MNLSEWLHVQPDFNIRLRTRQDGGFPLSNALMHVFQFVSKATQIPKLQPCLEVTSESVCTYNNLDSHPVFIVDTATRL